MATMTQEPEDIKDMESFLKMAKYPLVKHTDMPTDMREEAMDTCITAVEKYHTDMEKCTQVRIHQTCVACAGTALATCASIIKQIKVRCFFHFAR